jgi:hypothetical protein
MPLGEDLEAVVAWVMTGAKSGRLALMPSAKAGGVPSAGTLNPREIVSVLDPDLATRLTRSRRVDQRSRYIASPPTASAQQRNPVV